MATAVYVFTWYNVISLLKLYISMIYQTLALVSMQAAAYLRFNPEMYKC